MGTIVIGKHTLESLTSGMYSDPFVIYREYIQNSVDSIDKAYQNSLLIPGQEQIIVNLQPSEGIISIVDNGLGIKSQCAEHELMSIGNSKKNVSTDRGFRGIGRLAALSFCRELIFETSYIGEDIGTKIIINAQQLSDLLSITNHDSMPIEDVLNSICTCSIIKANTSDHYFSVTMRGVDNSSPLLNYNLVKDYLEQVAPVPYNPNIFTWGAEIRARLNQYGYMIPQYNIYLRYGVEKVRIFKPYKDAFLVDKTRDINDNIVDIEIVELRNDKNLMAVSWVAHSNYIGTIVDKSIKGLRIRKGNMLIGDGQTLNTVFKDARFNGWTLGEVFVLAPDLLPNARRDHFEKTTTYFLFAEQMSAIAGDITKKIRSASATRNTELAMALQKKEIANDAAKDILENPHIIPQKKSSVVQMMNAAQRDIKKLVPQNDVERVIGEIAFDELDMLIGKVKGATNYKALNTLDKLSKTEKKILEQVFIVLQNQIPAIDADKAIEAILLHFTRNGSIKLATSEK